MIGEDPRPVGDPGNRSPAICDLSSVIPSVVSMSPYDLVPRPMSRLSLPEIDATHWRRIVGVAIALVALVLVVRSDVLHGWLREGVATIDLMIDRHPLFGILAFVGLAALSAMLAFFSSAVAVPVGVAAWGEATTLVLLWTGWLIGGVASYAIGRFLGRRVVTWLLPEDRLRRYEGKVTHNATFPMLLLFQMALPSEIPGYLLGIVRCRFSVYVGALALAELPFAVGAVYLGRGFLDRDFRMLVGVSLVGILFAIAALIAWHRRTSDQ